MSSVAVIVILLLPSALSQGEDCPNDSHDFRTRPPLPGRSITLACPAKQHQDVDWHFLNSNISLGGCHNARCNSHRDGPYHPSINDTGFYMTIENFDRKRDGKIWVCNASEQSNTDAIGCYDLRIQLSPVKNVTIFELNASSNHGDAVTLPAGRHDFRCIPNVNSSSRYTQFHWSLVDATNTSVALPDNAAVSRDGIVSICQITLNWRMNNWSLQCNATNNEEDTPASYQLRLNVTYVENVRILGAKPSYKAGANLSGITCTAVCNPPCSFSWSMASVLVSNDSVLTIQELTNKTTGQYSCEATNHWSGTVVRKISINISDSQGEAGRPGSEEFPFLIVAAAGAGGGGLFLITIVITVACHSRNKEPQDELEMDPVPVQEKAESGDLVYADLEMSVQPGTEKAKKQKKKRNRTEEVVVIHGEKSSTEYADVIIIGNSFPQDVK